MEPDSQTLQELFNGVFVQFASLDWTINEIVGWGLIITAIVLPHIVGLFQRFVMIKWTIKQVTGHGRKEPKKSKLRKFFFPLLTKDPNDDMKPFLPFYAPVMLATGSAIIIGMYILVADTTASIFIGLLAYGCILLACIKLTRWQVRNKRW
ncbi:MAG: hypothetical protein ACI92I_000152 [Acidimicrobiales bacterium]|jgi:hypothetical protein